MVYFECPSLFSPWFWLWLSLALPVEAALAKANATTAEKSLLWNFIPTCSLAMRSSPKG